MVTDELEAQNIEVTTVALELFMEKFDIGMQPLNLERLKNATHHNGEDNYDVWIVRFEVVARHYELRPVINGGTVSFPEDVEMSESLREEYPFLFALRFDEEILVDAAFALISFNISRGIRKHPTFEDGMMIAMEASFPYHVMIILDRLLGPMSLEPITKNTTEDNFDEDQ